MTEQLHAHGLRLILCSLALLLIGAGFWLRKPSERLKGFGLMLSVWSAIDIVIGTASLLGRPSSNDQETVRFIWINIILDGVYVLSGFLMWARSSKPLVKGMGSGVQTQGLLLLILDLYLVHML